MLVVFLKWCEDKFYAYSLVATFMAGSFRMDLDPVGFVECSNDQSVG